MNVKIQTVPWGCFSNVSNSHIWKQRPAFSSELATTRCMHKLSMCKHCIALKGVTNYRYRCMAMFEFRHSCKLHALFPVDMPLVYTIDYPFSFQYSLHLDEALSHVYLHEDRTDQRRLEGSNQESRASVN